MQKIKFIYLVMESYVQERIIRESIALSKLPLHQELHQRYQWSNESFKSVRIDCQSQKITAYIQHTTEDTSSLFMHVYYNSKGMYGGEYILLEKIY